MQSTQENMSEILKKRVGMQARDGRSYGHGSGVSVRDHIDLVNNTREEITTSVQSRPSAESYHTAKTYEVSTEKGGRKLMSEEEVSSLVHNALRRARQATGNSHSVSPRVRNRIAPSSSPRSQLGASKPPLSPNTSNLAFPSDGEIYEQTSFGRAKSTRVGLPPKYSKVEDSMSMGDDVFSTPATSFEHKISQNMSNISAASSDFRTPSDLVSETPTEDSLSEHPGLVSVNSSEAIIRRVEAEIANARKAAHEANRRLAGVSAKLELTSVPDLIVRTPSQDQSTEMISRNFSMESDSMSAALNILAEEFDISDSNTNTLYKRDLSNDLQSQPSFDAGPAQTQESLLAHSKFAHKVNSVDSVGSTEWKPLEAKNSIEGNEVAQNRNVIQLESEKIDKERYSVKEGEPQRELKQAYKFDTTTGVYSIVDLTHDNEQDESYIPRESAKEPSKSSFPAAFSASGNAFMRSLNGPSNGSTTRDGGVGSSSKSEVIDLTAVESKSATHYLQLPLDPIESARSEVSSQAPLSYTAPSGQSLSENEDLHDFGSATQSENEQPSLPLDPTEDQQPEETTAFESDFNESIPGLESKDTIETVESSAEEAEDIGGQIEEETSSEKLVNKTTQIDSETTTGTASEHNNSHVETNEINDLAKTPASSYNDTEVSPCDSGLLSEVMADSVKSTGESSLDQVDSGESQPAEILSELREQGLPVPIEVQEADGGGFELTGFVPSSQVLTSVSCSNDEGENASEHARDADTPDSEQLEHQYSIEETESNVEVSLSIDQYDDHACRPQDGDSFDQCKYDAAEGKSLDSSDADKDVEEFFKSAVQRKSSKSETEEIPSEPCTQKSADETDVEPTSVNYISNVDATGLSRDEIDKYEEAENNDTEDVAVTLDSFGDEAVKNNDAEDAAVTLGSYGDEAAGLEEDDHNVTQTPEGGENKMEDEQGVSNDSDLLPVDQSCPIEEQEGELTSTHDEIAFDSFAEITSNVTENIPRAESSSQDLAHPPSEDTVGDSPDLNTESQVFHDAHEENESDRDPLEDTNGKASPSSIEDEGFSSRARRVRFKQRYPVPPVIGKPRKQEEIIKDNFIPHEEHGSFLSKPKPDLQQLLDAATGHSLQRRSNACGALKVLTTQKKNRLMLVRTSGFLDALVFAASAKISSRDMEASQDARARAVITIANVAEPKDNRELVFNHPGLLAALVKTAIDDHHESRTGACGALALLAKTPSNREPMARTSNLVSVLAMILRGGKNNGSFDEKPSYSADDEGSTDHSYSSDSRSFTSSRDSRSYASDDEVTLPTVMSMREQKKEKTEEIVKLGQLNACATLLHLSKQCGATPQMCLNGRLMDALIEVGGKADDPLHTKCLEILCNLSKFPHNAGFMAKYPGLVDTLVVNGSSKRVLDRTWSLRTLQNLSSDVAGKTVLANNVVLEMLSVSVMRDVLDEQMAATATLYNLSTEPGAVVPLTNTKNVVATLVHVAHNPESPSEVRIMACDALATLGLWLQTLAGAGTVPEDVDESIALPSYVTAGWQRWD